jgi:hypothetical protein
MKVTTLLSAVSLAALGADAWSFTVWTGENKKGLKRHYGSTLGENNCYPINKDITDKGIGSLTFCSMAWARCSITLHDEIGCRGEELGSATAAAPFGEWEKNDVSKKGSKAKSFRIQGCKHIPVTGGNLDCTKCEADP